MIKTKTDYIGYNATDLTTYLRKTAVGKAARRFFLLHGLPGTGKTTLINVLENEEHVTMRRSNASDARKTGDFKLGTFISGGIDNECACVVLDECDQLPAATWKKIEELSGKNNKIPIILIANSIKKIPKNIIKKCQQKELKISRFSLLAFARRENKENDLQLTESQIDEYVDRCRSYRCLQTLLKYGYSDEMEVPQTQNEMILTAMNGEQTEFKTGDIRNIVTIYHDNVKSARDLELISQADIFLNKYEHGYKYGKNIVNYILNCVRNKKDKLEYPRTYKLIYGARNKDKTIKSGSKKSKKKMPDIKILGLK